MWSIIRKATIAIGAAYVIAGAVAAVSTWFSAYLSDDVILVFINKAGERDAELVMHAIGIPAAIYMAYSYLRWARSHPDRL
jgi:hypothetical protein